MKLIRVVAAIIHKDGKIFATQRGYGTYKDYWEFPGGKIEVGETPEQALIREIQEELATTIQIERFLTTVEYDYPEFHLSMDCLSAPSFKANWIFWSTNLPAGFLKITCVMWNGCRQIC